jgi:hypothetical protein
MLTSFEDYFDDYELVDSEYKNKIEELSKMKCMAITNMGPSYSSDCTIFNIRGTRHFLIIRKIFFPLGIGDFIQIQMVWKLKQKNKKKFLPSSFEDVLDSKLISNSAKEEIVFNLNVFLTAS